MSRASAPDAPWGAMHALAAALDGRVSLPVVVVDDEDVVRAAALPSGSCLERRYLLGRSLEKLCGRVPRAFDTRGHGRVVLSDAEGEGVEAYAVRERHAAVSLAGDDAARDELEGAVHDVRSPLVAARGFTSLLERDCRARLGELGLDYVERIRTGLDRMETALERLLEHEARAEAPVAEVPKDAAPPPRGTRA